METELTQEQEHELRLNNFRSTMMEVDIDEETNFINYEKFEYNKGDGVWLPCFPTEILWVTIHIMNHGYTYRLKEQNIIKDINDLLPGVKYSIGGGKNIEVRRHTNHIVVGYLLDVNLNRIPGGTDVDDDYVSQIYTFGTRKFIRIN